MKKNAMRNLLQGAPLKHYTLVEVDKNFKIPIQKESTVKVDLQNMSPEEIHANNNEINIHEFVKNEYQLSSAVDDGSDGDGDLPYTLRLSKAEDGSLFLTVLIIGYIDPNECWMMLEKILDRLTAKDVVVMYIVSPGGSISGGMCVISAMKRCNAPITTVGMGLIASMGSAIWMYGNHRVAMPMCEIMYHMSSGLSYGNSITCGEEAVNIADFINTIFLKKAIELNIITSEEANKINTTKEDIYITAEEYNARQVKRGNND